MRLIDIFVPGDRRVEDKEQEKVEKYQDLTKELKKIWNTSVTVIPIVIEALGAVSNFRGEADQTKHRQERYPKRAIHCIAGISENI